MDLTPAVPARLSPNNWDPTERAVAEQLQQGAYPHQVRIVQGDSGLIAATLSPIAVHAGIEALKQGGTAADAATAIALTQVTTALGSVVSYAGIRQLLYYDSTQQQVYSLDAGWNSY